MLKNKIWYPCIISYGDSCEYEINLGKEKFKYNKNNYKAFDNDNKYLLKQNESYYSIKSEFYKNKEFKTLEITEPTKDDFKKYGFENINDIYNKISEDNEEIIIVDRLKAKNKGKYDILMKEL